MSRAGSRRTPTVAVLPDDVRAEVKAAVEEWFSDISLDDLFSVRGWS